MFNKFLLSNDLFLLIDDDKKVWTIHIHMKYKKMPPDLKKVAYAATIACRDFCSDLFHDSLILIHWDAKVEEWGPTAWFNTKNLEIVAVTGEGYLHCRGFVDFFLSV